MNLTADSITDEQIRKLRRNVLDAARNLRLASDYAAADEARADLAAATDAYHEAQSRNDAEMLRLAEHIAKGGWGEATALAKAYLRLLRRSADAHR